MLSRSSATKAGSMRTTKPIPTPEEFQGLGLDQDQLRQVHTYFRLRLDVARQRRQSAIGLLILLCATFALRVFDSESEALPYQGVVGLVMPWLVGLGFLGWLTTVVLQQVRVSQLNAAVGQLKVSPRAQRTIVELASGVAFVVTFAPFSGWFLKGLEKMRPKAE